MLSDIKLIGEVLGDNVLVVLFIVVALSIGLSKAAESYESISKILGPLGKKIRKAKQDRDVLQEDERRKELEIEARRILVNAGALEPKDYKALRTRFDNLLSEVKALNRTVGETQLENRGLRTYILQDEEWHWEDQRQALREQRTVRPRVTFDEYMSAYMKKNSPAEWTEDDSSISS